MTDHRVGAHDEWLAARLELLEDEKELTRRNDELACTARRDQRVQAAHGLGLRVGLVERLQLRWGMWQWLDRAPFGRQGDDGIWVRHDEYEGGTA